MARRFSISSGSGGVIGAARKYTRISSGSHNKGVHDWLDSRVASGGFDKTGMPPEVPIIVNSLIDDELNDLRDNEGNLLKDG